MPRDQDRPIRTAGAAALDNAGSPGELQRLLDKHPSVIWAWRAGTRRPGPVERERIARLLGIPVDAWLTREERRALRATSRPAA